ncbi:MAG: hemolysin family protein [Anaerolineales bacterium]|nr:hemolysin family protein [Anaerolineales bacterium]
MDAELAPLMVQIIAVAILLFLNGFFVSVEFAYITASRPRINQLAAKGNASAALVNRLLGDTDRLLAVSQIGITMASLGIGWVGESAAEQVIHRAFAFIPGLWSNAIAQVIGLILAFAFITALHIVLGEQAPKIVAIQTSERFAMFSARAVTFFDALLSPLVAVLDAATSAIVQLVGIKPLGAHQTVYTVDELKQLVVETQQHGELQPREKVMLHNVFEFDDKLVREVMLPRPDMITVAEDTTIADFLQTFSAASHSRFPIHAGSIDNVTGFIAIKDVLRAISSHGAPALEQTVRAFARTALFVPETKHIGALFAEMQAQKVQIAVVIDEFGGTAGMITMEELVEEIVGNLQDEFAHEPPLVQTIDEHTTQVDAQMRVEEANEQLRLHLPEDEEYTTIAGYILHTLRRIPKEGEQLVVGNIKLTVTKLDGPKIEQIQVTRS